MKTDINDDMRIVRGGPVLAHVGLAAPVCGRLALGVAGIAGCILLTSLGAQVRIPVPGTEVPMTLQVMAVLVTGFMLTPARAVAAMVLYLACGAAGLPVFTLGSMGLAGPTGGYLVGFVVAAWLVSVLKGSQGARLGRLLAAGAVGTFAVFAVGTAWRACLALLFGFHGGDFWLAASTGLLPFLPKAVVELIGAAMLVTSFRGMRLTRRRAL